MSATNAQHASTPPKKVDPRSLFQRVGFYGSLCLLSIVLYGCIEFRGYGAQPGARGQVPMGMRHQTGYRSFHFWHSGLHGGK